jgi:hypothetical protein
LNDLLDILAVRLKQTWHVFDRYHSNTFSKGVFMKMEKEFYIDLIKLLEKKMGRHAYWNRILSMLEDKIEQSEGYFFRNFDEHGFFLFYLTTFNSAIRWSESWGLLYLGSIFFFLSFFNLVLSFLRIFYSQPILVEATRVSLSSDLHLFMCMLKYTWFNFK